MNPIRSWKKVMAVGCNHGAFGNESALKAVLKFAEEWKPVHRIHLGDNFDCEAFMSSRVRDGSGSAMEPDLTAGKKFLQQFRPTTFCFGNHEDRIVQLCHDHNNIIACAADAVLRDMLQPLKAIKCAVIPYTIHAKGWYQLGGYKWGHGHLWNENYLRDTAEAVGNCVVAHAHRAGVAKGRRSDNPTAYGVGTLCDVEKMGYAARRRSTLSWSAGFCFGEVCADAAQLCLWEWPQGTTSFRLPI